MKKIIIVIACMLAGISAYAQGTVNFNNRVPAAATPVDAPIYDVGGTTRLSGTGFYAQLYGAAVGGTLAAIGDPLTFSTGRPGYVLATGVDTTRAIPGVTPGGNAVVQIRAWSAASGSTYEAALAAGGAVGSSDTLTLVTGGGGSPPGPPADLIGLQSFSLTAIPEPSTLALGLLGAALLVIRRRK